MWLRSIQNQLPFPFGSGHTLTKHTDAKLKTSACTATSGETCSIESLAGWPEAQESYCVTENAVVFCITEVTELAWWPETCLMTGASGILLLNRECCGVLSYRSCWCKTCLMTGNWICLMTGGSGAVVYCLMGSYTSCLCSRSQLGFQRDFTRELNYNHSWIGEVGRGERDTERQTDRDKERADYWLWIKGEVIDRVSTLLRCNIWQ